MVNAKATIRLGLNSEKHLTVLLEALAPEINRFATSRAKVALTRDDCFLVLSVEAQDTVALRAALNSYLRWINSALRVLSFVDTFS